MLYGNLSWCTTGLDRILHGRLNLGPAWNSGSKCKGVIKWCNQQLEADTSFEDFSKFQQYTSTEMNSPTVHLRVSWGRVGKKGLQQAGSLLAGKKEAAFLNYHCSSFQESCSKCDEEMLWMSDFQRPSILKWSGVLKRRPNLLYPTHYPCGKTGKYFQCQILSGELPWWPCKAQGRAMPSSQHHFGWAEQSLTKRGGQPSLPGQPPTEAVSPGTYPAWKDVTQTIWNLLIASSSAGKMWWRMPVVQTALFPFPPLRDQMPTYQLLLF